MQARFTASAHAAKSGRVLNTGSKNRALFLLGVLGVGVWSYRPCKTTARSLSCTGKGGTRKELSGHHLTHASGRLDVAVGMLWVVLLSLPEGSGLFVPLGYSHPGRVDYKADLLPSFVQDMFCAPCAQTAACKNDLWTAVQGQMQPRIISIMFICKHGDCK